MHLYHAHLPRIFHTSLQAGPLNLDVSSKFKMLFSAFRQLPLVASLVAFPIFSLLILKVDCILIVLTIEITQGLIAFSVNVANVVNFK